MTLGTTYTERVVLTSPPGPLRVEVVEAVPVDRHVVLMPPLPGALYVGVTMGTVRVDRRVVLALPPGSLVLGVAEVVSLERVVEVMSVPGCVGVDVRLPIVVPVA